MAKKSGFITYDPDDLLKIPKMIKRMEREGVKTKKPLKKWAAYIFKETINTFNRGGRGRVKWKPLAESTLRQRRAKGITGTKPLIATGTGRQSIQTAVHRKRAVVFTRQKYMKTHQEGRGKIPQRKFLFLTGKDRKEGVRLLREHAKDSARAMRRRR